LISPGNKGGQREKCATATGTRRISRPSNTQKKGNTVKRVLKENTTDGQKKKSVAKTRNTTFQGSIGGRQKQKNTSKGGTRPGGGKKKVNQTSLLEGSLQTARKRREGHEDNRKVDGQGRSSMGVLGHANRSSSKTPRPDA